MKENKNEAREILSQSIIIINAISCILEPFLQNLLKNFKRYYLEKPSMNETNSS